MNKILFKTGDNRNESLDPVQPRTTFSPKGTLPRYCRNHRYSQLAKRCPGGTHPHSEEGESLDGARHTQVMEALVEFVVTKSPIVQELTWTPWYLVSPPP